MELLDKNWQELDLKYQSIQVSLSFCLSLSVCASFLFGTQQQLTYPLVINSTLSLREMPVFQGVATWHTTFTSFCVIPLWDSATAHSASRKDFHPSSQEDNRFSGCCTSAYNFHFILRHSSLGLSNSSLLIFSH